MYNYLVHRVSKLMDLKKCVLERPCFEEPIFFDIKKVMLAILLHQISNQNASVLEYHNQSCYLDSPHVKLHNWFTLQR